MGALIDIPLLLTQMAAFVIVWWILYKFAWQSILGAIDERRDRIESQLKHAEDIEKQAEVRQGEYEAKLREIDAEARERLNKAIDEGRKLADGIQKKAHEEARAIVEQGRRNVELELAKAQTILEERAVELVISTSERLIKQKLDDEGQRSLVRDFIDRAAQRN